MVAAIFACLMGCTTGKLVRKNTPNGCCADCTGFSYTPVSYGDSRLKVLPATEIGQGSAWLLRLKPREGYESAVVTVSPKDEGTSEECEAAVSGGLDWLNATGSADKRAAGSAAGSATGKPELSICVPEDVPIGCVYGYDVEVEGVGILDPRARVVRH